MARAPRISLGRAAKMAGAYSGPEERDGRALTGRPWLCWLLALALLLAGSGGWAAELSIQGARFAVDGRPAFLVGISYFAALGAPAAFLRQDLGEMQRNGFNFIRVWATWRAFGNDASAVDREGNSRPIFMSRLQALVADCDPRGMVVDITLAPNRGSSGTPCLPTLAAHRLDLWEVAREVPSASPAGSGRRNRRVLPPVYLS